MTFDNEMKTALRSLGVNWYEGNKACERVHIYGVFHIYKTTTTTTTKQKAWQSIYQGMKKGNMLRMHAMYETFLFLLCKSPTM